VGHQPIEQHAYGRELLLDRRCGNLVLQLLYISGDVMGPDRGRREATIFAPGEEPGAGPGVSAARVRVADVGGEEFDVAPGCFVAEIGDQRRHDIQRALVGGDFGRRDGRRQLVLWFLGLGQNGPPYPVLSDMIKDVIIRETLAKGRGGGPRRTGVALWRRLLGTGPSRQSFAIRSCSHGRTYRRIRTSPRSSSTVRGRSSPSKSSNFRAGWSATSRSRSPSAAARSRLSSATAARSSSARCEFECPICSRIRTASGTARCVLASTVADCANGAGR